MKYLHTMVRVTDIEASLHFWCELMGLEEATRKDYPEGKFTLIFLTAPEDRAAFEAGRAPALELTHNWDSDETYTIVRHAMAVWLLFVRLTVSLLNFSKKAGLKPCKNHGHPWAIRVNGNHPTRNTLAVKKV